MKRMHRVVAPKRSRPGRRFSTSVVSQARAIHALRSRPKRSAFVAVATVAGSSPQQATRGFRNLRAKAFQAQLVLALARRRRQMLVSLWALPLSKCLPGLRGTESSGSGVGGVQAILRFSTVGDAQPFVQADGFAAA